MSSDVHSYRARWIFPVDAQPIENATLRIEADRIAAIHTNHDPRAVDLGNAALIPGLVNAHTHLEFSELAEPIQPALPFTDWIRGLVAHRQTRTLPTAERIGQGIHESSRSGTTLLGEIATEQWSDAAIDSEGPQFVVFRELIGRRNDQIEEQLSIAREHLESTADSPDSRSVRGISPHAPYSVHPELFHQLVDLACAHRAPLAIHVAETRAELELLADGTGEFVRLFKDFGVWQEGVIPLGSRPMDYLLPMAKLDRGLVIHGNYLSEDELEFLTQHSNLTLVFCPRTHRFFQHTEHPWQTLLERGVNVAVGTDSRASNPDLSVWRELLFLHASHPNASPRALLELGTINGARALGVNRETGSLTPGKTADLAVVSLPNIANSEPLSLLFNPRNRIMAAMCRGSWTDR